MPPEGRGGVAEVGPEADDEEPHALLDMTAALCVTVLRH